MEVVTAPGGAPLSPEPLPRLRNYPLTRWMKEGPLPASLPGWATAAPSLITAFSAWTRRYLPSSSLLSPPSFERAERKPEPATSVSLPSYVCALCWWAQGCPYGFQCAELWVPFAEIFGLTYSAVPYIILYSYSLKCSCCICPKQQGSAQTSWNPDCQEILGIFLMHFNVPVKPQTLQWGI